MVRSCSEDLTELNLTVLSTSGPPIAGWLVDQTGSKDNAFYLSAALLLTSAVICVAAWLAQKIIEKRRRDSTD